MICFSLFFHLKTHFNFGKNFRIFVVHFKHTFVGIEIIKAESDMEHIIYRIVERCSVVNAAIGYIYICESVYIQSVAKQIFRYSDCRRARTSV